jgi:hypothetical protein
MKNCHCPSEQNTTIRLTARLVAVSCEELGLDDEERIRV